MIIETKSVTTLRLSNGSTVEIQPGEKLFWVDDNDGFPYVLAESVVAATQLYIAFMLENRHCSRGGVKQLFLNVEEVDWNSGDNATSLSIDTVFALRNDKIAVFGIQSTI